jgi:hypothetical protein
MRANAADRRDHDQRMGCWAASLRTGPANKALFQGATLGLSVGPIEEAVSGPGPPPQPPRPPAQPAPRPARTLLPDLAAAAALTAAILLLYHQVLRLWWTHDDIFVLHYVSEHRPLYE